MDGRVEMEKVLHPWPYLRALTQSTLDSTYSWTSCDSAAPQCISQSTWVFVTCNDSSETEAVTFLRPHPSHPSPLASSATGSITDWGPQLWSSQIHLSICSKVILPRAALSQWPSVAGILRQAHSWGTWDFSDQRLWPGLGTSQRSYWTFLRIALQSKTLPPNFLPYPSPSLRIILALRSDGSPSLSLLPLYCPSYRYFLWQLINYLSIYVFIIHV